MQDKEAAILIGVATTESDEVRDVVNDINESQNVAIGWLVGFGLCLLGMLALPIYADSQSTLEVDGGQVMPLLILMAILIGLAIVGRTSPVASGLASGVVALLSLALGAAIVFGLIFSVILGDFGGGVQWGGGAAAVVAAAVCGVIAVLVSARGWGGYSPEAWTPVAVFGSIAIMVMVGGASAPQNGATWADALGFSVHPVVGFGFTAFLAGIAAVGVAGFVTGRWGIGLLTGFLGFLLISWFAARSGDQAEVASWSGVSQNVQPVAAVGFWCAAGLFAVHVIQQTSAVTSNVTAAGRGATTSCEATVGPSTPRPSTSGKAKTETPGEWARDPFGRFINRYFDGTEWTNKVSSTGSIEIDEPTAAAPVQRAAAWLPDPFERHQHRYFNGVGWTGDVSNAGATGQDPAVAHPPAAQSPLLAGHSESDSAPTAPASMPAAPAWQGGGQIASETKETPDVKVGPMASGGSDVGDATVPRRSLAMQVPGAAFDIVSRTGDVINLATTVIVGRQPSPVDNHQGATLRSIDDQTVSKSHAIFGCDGDGPWVIDLHSLNGVGIEHNPTRVVTPGQPCRLALGDVVVLGDSVSFELKAAAS